MLIANPLYDSVFKFLMEDAEVARRLIGVIIGEEIVSLEALPQERTATVPGYLLTVYHLDFKAVIKTSDNKHKKVLIELQKSRRAFDILRFRNYIGNNYRYTEEIDGEKRPLPIIPIYILGFKLSIQRPLLKIGGNYTDISSGEVLDQKDDFIECLSHDCFVIQIPCLSSSMQSKVDKMLSVFNQEWVIDHDERWILRYPQDLEVYADEDLQLVLNRLESLLVREEFRDRIEAEAQLELFPYNKFMESDRKAAEKEVALRKAEKEKRRIEEEKERIEEEKRRAEEEARRLENEKRKGDQEIERLRSMLEAELRFKEDMLRRMEDLERKLKP